MPAIKGQPAPKPESLDKPVPQDNAEAEAQAFLADYSPTDMSEAQEFLAQENITPQATPPPAEVPAEQGFQPVDALPIAGGIVGGMVGLPFAGLSAGTSMVGGATLGAAAGQSMKRIIEMEFLGKPPKPLLEEAKDSITEALMSGAGEIAGLGITKAFGKAVKGMPKETLDDVIQTAAPVKSFIRRTLNSARDEILEPVNNFIRQKGTKLNTEQAGNTVKQLFNKNISTKLGTHMDDYARLEKISQALPLEDEVRRKFTTGLKDWSNNTLAGDNARVIRRFADEIDAIGNGAQFDNIIKQIRGEASEAYQKGRTDQYKVLKEFQEKAEDFLAGRIERIAGKISSGKATPQELQIFGNMFGDSTGQTVKQTAKNYLQQKETVKEAYKGFRGFLSDVGEQARIKGVDRMGPKAFLDELNDIPAEKLMERMFDPKNAAALRKMQKETPEIFDLVTKSKLTNIVNKASPAGEFNYQTFYKELMKLPESARNFIANPKELAAIGRSVNNPRLKSLKSLEDRLDGPLLRLIFDTLEAAKIAAPSAGRGTARVTGQTLVRGGNNPSAPSLKGMRDERRESK